MGGQVRVARPLARRGDRVAARAARSDGAAREGLLVDRRGASHTRMQPNQPPPANNRMMRHHRRHHRRGDGCRKSWFHGVVCYATPLSPPRHGRWRVAGSLIRRASIMSWRAFAIAFARVLSGAEAWPSHRRFLDVTRARVSCRPLPPSRGIFVLCDARARADATRTNSWRSATPTSSRSGRCRPRRRHARSLWVAV